MINNKKWAIVAALLLTTLSPANAALITWTLNGVTFDDGTEAVGSFDYDASVGEFGTYANVDISVMAGVLPTYTYEDSNSFIGLANANMVDFVDDALNSYLRLVFDAPLDNSGGARSLVGDASYECSNCSDFRYVTAGTVSASPVPVPAAAWLLASALAGLGFSARKK